MNPTTIEFHDTKNDGLLHIFSTVLLWLQSKYTQFLSKRNDTRIYIRTYLAKANLVWETGGIFHGLFNISWNHCPIGIMYLSGRFQSWTRCRIFTNIAKQGQLINSAMHGFKMRSAIPLKWQLWPFQVRFFVIFRITTQPQPQPRL